MDGVDLVVLAVAFFLAGAGTATLFWAWMASRRLRKR